MVPIMLVLNLMALIIILGLGRGHCRSREFGQALMWIRDKCGSKAIKRSLNSGLI